ncbi:carbohydrate binding family 9 domain-containing protein [Undibacterium squillarum]|uniref:carbohydrate binding family 9 domain-containing protein n=1 Tax=Undibacterium squillarum TaxID=1131567 RepID=UPI0035AE1256
MTFRKKTLLACLLTSAFFGTMTSGAHAQTQSFQAVRIPDNAPKINIDGKLNDPLWQSAPVSDTFYQTQPIDKQKAHLKTEVRILYDDKYLYVGIRAYDNAPADIRAPFARRDKVSIDQDFIALYIDPSGAHKASQVFYVNARGAVMDGIYSDMTGDDTAPDYQYDVATAIDSEGWTAEYRIPFSEIAYNKDATQPWSLLVLRNMTRDQRYRMYSGGVTRAASCNLCFSDPVTGLRDLPSASNWHLTPQLVVRRAEDRSGDQVTRSASSRDLSLDLKFRPDSSTTIDSTIKPDFSQIELDAPQLSGNTKFSIFSPEKRPFFLEGADIFKTPLNVISTRSIANPDAGLRYTKRDEQKDISVLVSRDAAGGLVLLPNSYYTGLATSATRSVATDARVNFRFGNMSAGAVLTDRNYGDGRGYNRVFGPDLVWQADENELLRIQLLGSQTTAQAGTDGNLQTGNTTSGYAAFADWYRGNDAWSYSATYKDFSKNFRADNGFFAQTGFRSVNGELVRKWGKYPPLHELNSYLQAEYKLDSDGNLMSQSFTPGIRIASHYDSSAYFAVSPSVRSRIQRFGEAYDTRKILTGFALSPGRHLARMTVDMTFGDTIDVDANRTGRGGTLTASAKIRAHDRLEIEPSYAVNWIDHPGNTTISQKGRAFTETAIQLNTIAHISSKDTLRWIYQGRHTSRNPSLYNFSVTPDSQRQVNSVVYTHTQALGKVIYLGWTQSTAEAAVTSPRTKQQEIFAKFSWRI